MQNGQHQNIVGFIWNIANKLRGPYRPPQYRKVMLPLTVLRRFDLVLAQNKQKVLDEKKRLEAKGIKGPALEKALSRIAADERKQPLFNTSGFTFESSWATRLISPVISSPTFRVFRPEPVTSSTSSNLKPKLPNSMRPIGCS